MNSLPVLRQRLARGQVIVIDGGMGAELARRGVPMHPVAWAAPAALSDPTKVRAAHEAYLRAGAEIIITNTFMAGYHALQAAGMGEQAAQINRRSVELACQARDNAATRPTLIAGALFPGYFGCEVHNMVPPVPESQLRARLLEQAEVLAEAGVDLLAFEMVPTGTWGRMALEAIATLGLPVWLGVSYGLLEGIDITMPLDPPGDLGLQIRQIMAGNKADIMAIQVMHTNVPDVSHALSEVRKHWQGAVGTYPHYGTHDASQGAFLTRPIEPQQFAEHARQWVQQGSQFVGGCCGIGPEHIQALSTQFQ